ncbi:SGNH/GDSL hydrolase family protein [Sutcliffiella horikoshii]|uniref:SGNH/GDSL hydrolase family protein n=1 Tax=Sutcliffiella horikoshii TaxID=79883 RepID=A0A5D4T3H0_9BACI|nr:SGNH/GDSL hydrolase family protein [Sutcliffiella horikoshii]TYS69849.1 SGNH/GDSL hydrolase family protein [Sutcliffiella horikoshii]
MKKILIILFSILAMSLIFLGKMQYDNKIAQAGKAVQQDQTSDSTDGSLIALTENMSGDLQAKVKSMMESEVPIKVLIVGSGAIMNGDANNLPWPLLVKNALEDNYGNDVFEIDVLNFENITTNHLIEIKGHEQIAAKQADVLIIEPLLLNDDGFVKIEHTLQNLKTIIDSVLQVNPETHVMLQPPNPIFEPVAYLEQVEALEEYALKNEIEYLNHWPDWPDTSSEDIKEVIKGSFPNAKGQEIWANYFINYFIAK